MSADLICALPVIMQPHNRDAFRVKKSKASKLEISCFGLSLGDRIVPQEYIKEVSMTDNTISLVTTTDVIEFRVGTPMGNFPVKPVTSLVYEMILAIATGQTAEKAFIALRLSRVIRVYWIFVYGVLLTVLMQVPLGYLWPHFMGEIALGSAIVICGLLIIPWWYARTEMGVVSVSRKGTAQSNPP